MIYIVNGEQKPLIDKKVDELIKKHLNEINDFTLIKYDLEVTPLSSVVDDAITYPFGYNHKVLVLNNPYFLFKDKKISLDFEQTFEEFEQYLEDQSDFTTIIIVAFGDKLDKKESFNKKLVANSNLVSIKEIGKYDWINIVEQRVKEFKGSISKEAIDELLSRVGEDLLRLEIEIDKLVLCSKKVNLDHVNSLVAPQLDDNIFSLLDSMIDGDVQKTMKVYNNFRSQNIEPTQLLTIMASQMRFIYQVAINYENGLRQEEIATTLNVHPYRVSLALNRVRKGNNSDYILKLLDQFSALDIDIKTGQVDRYQAFELFLLKFIFHQC